MICVTNMLLRAFKKDSLLSQPCNAVNCLRLFFRIIVDRELLSRMKKMIRNGHLRPVHCYEEPLNPLDGVYLYKVLNNCNSPFSVAICHEFSMSILGL